MHVLLIATRYDLPTALSHAWASTLHEQLVRRKHVCNLLTAEPLCRAGHVMTEAIDRADVVVYFGHGQNDSWTGLPAGSTGVGEVTIVDQTSIGTLGSRPIYAGCCNSFAGLAPLHAGPYLGYDNPFSFETINHAEFGKVVISSVMDFVAGNTTLNVAANLRSNWDRLCQDFTVGALSGNRNAIMAAHCADQNARRVQAL